MVASPRLRRMNSVASDGTYVVNSKVICFVSRSIVNDLEASHLTSVKWLDLHVSKLFVLALPSRFSMELQRWKHPGLFVF